MKRRRASRIDQHDRAADESATYYALNSAPAYNMFGSPDFRDADGREYRIAFKPGDSTHSYSAARALVSLRATRDDTGELLHADATADDLIADYARREVPIECITGPDDTTVRLWVRLPRRPRGAHLPWPKSESALTLTLVNHLLPTAEAADVVQAVRVSHSRHTRHLRATGYVDVEDLPPYLCDQLLDLRRNAIANTGE